MERDVNRVYALSGSCNTGKTSTLLCLIKMLRESSENILLDEPLDYGDHRAIFMYHGQRIGVITQGDNVKEVKSHLDAIEDQCDIIFCATRTRGSTTTHVIKRYKEKLTWVPIAGIFDHVNGTYNNENFIINRNISMAKILFQEI